MEWFRRMRRHEPGPQKAKVSGQWTAFEASIGRTIPTTLSLHERAQAPVLREHDGVPLCQIPSTSGRDFEVSAPLRIRLAAAKGGQLDLQLRLFELAYGDHVQRQRRELLHWKQGWKDAKVVAANACSLTFLGLAFPDRFPAVENCLATVGLVAAATTVLRKAPFNIPKRLSGLAKQLPRQLRKTVKKQQKRLKSHLGGLANAKSAAIVARCQELSSAAAVMAALTLVWRAVHPTSHQLMQAVVVALNLSSGYACTVRQAAQGRISAGPKLEAAWRARHKWAAQKAARVMMDSYDSPPLQPVLTFAQKVSIGMVLLMSQPPAPFVPSSVQLPEQTSAWTAPGHNPLWQISMSLPGGKRLQGPSGAEMTQQPSSASAVVSRSSAGQDSAAAKPPSAAADPIPARAQPILKPAQPTGRQTGNTDASVLEQELTSKFLPSKTEGLRTGELPTICSLEELEAVQKKVAAEPRSVQQTPFAVAVNTVDGEQPESSQTAKEASSSKGTGVEKVHLLTTEEIAVLEPSIKSGRPWGRADEQKYGDKLALYGKADHMKETPLTLLEKQKMVLRGMYLLTVFLPFLLLGPLLILISSFQRRKNGAIVSRPVQDKFVNNARQTLDVVQKPGVVGELVPEPTASSTGPRNAAWRLLLFSIRNSGAAFIKWGQWSATREDMFPVELCRVLANLHDRAPTHSWAESRRSIEAAFGKPVSKLFEKIDEAPIASGSIAQVHRAVMVVAGKRRDVAVKVRHPGVEVRIKQDFQLLKPLAAAASKIKALKGLSLKESLAQFSSTMTAQADLRVEAVHLMRFFRNFAPVRGSVTPPFPLPGFITEAVLIETFEPGESVAKYINDPAPFNTQIVALGVDTYLKMLLTDDFVHTDLHPGNIMVRRRDGGELSRDTLAEAVRGQLQLVLLDFGLAEELSPQVRKHFLSFLHMVAAGNGERAAAHILQWSSDQQCQDPVAFTAAMKSMFAADCNIHTPQGIELDRVMKSVLRIARQFEVSIDSSYAALVIGMVVLVGFATSMDPNVNLMDAAAPAFLQHNLLGKVTGRLYS